MSSTTSFEDLARASRAERSTAFGQGTAPSPESLTGWEFRGWNTAPITALFGFRKFIKALFLVAGDPYGCNTPAEQGPLEKPWVAKPSEEAPKRYAFYAVETANPHHPHALLLDYGRGHNGFFQPARLLRDHVVRVAPDSDDVLLGKAYLALGPLRLPLTYFVLERRRPLPDAPSLPS